MTVKDHATRFTVLIALPNKEGVTIATELERLFSIIGYPLVYHTDNAGELCGALAQDVLERLRDGVADATPSQPVQGGSYNPREQGSAERCNRSTKDKIQTAVEQERSDGNPDANWLTVLPKVSRSLNATAKSRSSGNAAPYLSVFGMPYYINASLPVGTAFPRTEEGLLNILPEDSHLRQSLQASQPSSAAHEDIGTDRVDASRSADEEGPAPIGSSAEEEGAATSAGQPDGSGSALPAPGAAAACEGPLLASASSAAPSGPFDRSYVFYRYVEDGSTHMVGEPMELSLRDLLLELEGEEQWESAFSSVRSACEGGGAAALNTALVVAAGIVQRHLEACHTVRASSYVDLVGALLFMSTQADGEPDASLASASAPAPASTSNRKRRARSDPPDVSVACRASFGPPFALTFFSLTTTPIALLLLRSPFLACRTQGRQSESGATVTVMNASSAGPP